MPYKGNGKTEGNRKKPTEHFYRLYRLLLSIETLPKIGKALFCGLFLLTGDAGEVMEEGTGNKHTGI